MKTVRTLAIIPLALISLMNVGYPFGTDPIPELTPAIAALVLGVAGLVAVLGLARNTSWGLPAAVAVAGVNVTAAVIALVAGSEGAVIGLVISSLALALSFAASPGRRTTSPA